MQAGALLSQLARYGLRLTAEGDRLRVEPRAALTDEARELIRKHKAELLAALEMDRLSDPAAEARRQRVLAMLDANPGSRYAVVTDSETDPDAVILALAIRGRATCELRIARDRYDPFLLFDLIERHSGTIH